jgi:hypothetical protein
MDLNNILDHDEQIKSENKFIFNLFILFFFTIFVISTIQMDITGAVISYFSLLTSLIKNYYE